MVAPATASHINRELQRLTGLKFPPSSGQAYVEALSDLEPALLTAAVTAAQRTCREFPSPAELREFAEAARMARPLPVESNRATALSQPFVIELPSGKGIPVEAHWRYYCEACSDTGWKSWWCGDTTPKPWQERGRCQRDTDHAEHEWVDHCQCQASNPAVLRKRESQARMAAQRLAAAGEKRR